MTTAEISQMIDSMGFDYNYYQFPEKEAPEPPYILFYYPSSNNFAADGKVYTKITQLNIEFYSAEKDFDGEAAIETVLDEYGFIYEKEEQYIEQEKMYEILYTMEVTL